MLRFFCETAALSVVLTSLVTEPAFSRPLFSQQPEMHNSGVGNSSLDVPLCYMQTADGRIVDLQQLCSNSNQDSPASTNLSEGVSKTRSLRVRSGYAEDNKGGEDTRSE